VPFYGSQAYGKKFITLAGSAAEGTILGLPYDIFEDKATNPSVDTFLTWYQRTNPGADIDFFAIQSWVAADLFVQALQKVGPNVTRDKLGAALQSFTSFDAHGFLAPINPPGKTPAACFLVVGVQGGQWKRLHPDAGFSC
jgi:ABC-type branched-subunit amino acid transport system substrate-binding protein